MSIEKQIKFDPDNKRGKTEQEQKIEIARKLDFEKRKKEIMIRIKKNKELAYLKSMIERWLIWLNTAEHIIKWEHLGTEEIHEIFDKINQIEDVKNINTILPEYLRINREEYIEALEDDKKRKVLLIKIDNTLKYIYNYMNPSHSPIMSLFYGLMYSLDGARKELIIIQENLIDIKRSLQ